MKHLTIIQKQFIAGILAALLLMVTGVKFFHTCAEEEVIEVSSLSDQLSTNASCAICEYHLLQDVDLTITAPALEPVSIPLHQAVPFFRSHFTSSIGLHFSDRGPPQVA